MVHNYKPKNRYEKWSKLTTEQTTYLLRVYFVPFNLDRIAQNAGLSRRTVETKLARINEFILSDLECRSAIIDYLLPELDGVDWLSRNEDLSAESDFWERARICYFKCPGLIEPALHIEQLSRFKALKYMEEMMVQKGIITMVRVRCAACPIQKVRDNVPFRTLLAAKTDMIYYKRTSSRVFRSSLFRFLFYAALTKRAGDAKDAALDVDPDQAYRKTMDKNLQDLAIIVAHHLTRRTASL
ncbi:hypothetical protein [Neoaquamicrobium sediminum]|uniref:hypothetical protein n=1 Tax=Neoaquamicrobium sediminum TaxID=1849104 RepID=UPI003BAB5366